VVLAGGGPGLEAPGRRGGFGGVAGDSGGWDGTREGWFDGSSGLDASVGGGVKPAVFETAHNGLALARQEGRVPRPLVPGLRGLCAFFETAHNGLALARQEGRVPRPLVPGLRGLCAWNGYSMVLEHRLGWTTVPV
jgi:hypothetical protein